MSEHQLVFNAVAQKDVSKKQSILQRLFAVWFDAFVYNQIWEDPRVDLKALKFDDSSRVLTISSGGCNALNYLIENPQSVTAIDLNRHHIYLLNLKLAALKHLPDYESFFNFFGFGKHDDNISNYEKYIKSNLDSGSRQFWENTSLFRQPRINYFAKSGLYEHSRNGYFLRFFHQVARLLGCKPEEILKARSTEEQEQYYQRFIKPFFDSWIIKLVGKLPITTFGLGIPPQQFEELKKDLGQGGALIDVFRERSHRLAVEFPIADNYFAWQAFGRKYDTEKRIALPEYLKEKNFKTLQRNSGNLKTKIGSITEEINIQPRHSFNRFVFLDAQDWMNAELLTELWSAIAQKAETGSRIIFRTAGSSSPVESNLPKDLRSKFLYEKEMSDDLFKKDRASIYGGFHLYVLK